MNMDWQTSRNRFMRDIGGDPPSAQLEDELIQAYADHPDMVTRSLEKIALAHKAGKIRSPWGALKAEVAKAIDATRNPTRDAGAGRERAIQRAEQRTRNEFVHYDRWAEVEDELFGERGTLQAYDTPTLRERMEALWNDVRPLGIQTELEAEERARRHIEQRARAAQADKPIGNLTTDAA